MHPSEKFRRFAAECHAMRRLARSQKSKAEWNHLATRWLQHAESFDHCASTDSGNQDGPLRRSGKRSAENAHRL
jgi:hypothetical protein